MGAVATREEIISKLEQLDQKELDLNLKLKDLQIQLNGMVPEEEKIKVNAKLFLLLWMFRLTVMTRPWYNRMFW